MKTFEITYLKNGIYFIMLVKGYSKCQVINFFKKRRPSKKIIATVELTEREVEQLKNKSIPLIVAD